MALQLVEPMPVQLSLELEQHAILRASQFGGHVPDSINVGQWISLAEPGMVASTDSHGHMTYSFDAPKTHFVADSTYVGIAELTCVVYNALPPESRVVPASINPAVIAPDANCTSHVTQVSYWWGAKIHFDHCACNDVELALVGTGSSAATAAGLLGIFGTLTGPGLLAAGVVAIVCTAVAGAAATYAGAFTWADTKSGNGAYLNFTWVSPGTPWVTPS